MKKQIQHVTSNISEVGRLVAQFQFEQMPNPAARLPQAILRGIKLRISLVGGALVTGRGLMGAIPSLKPITGPLAQIDGAMPRLNARPTGCAFNPRCPSVMDHCRKQSPTLTTRSAHHDVACWLGTETPHDEKVAT